MSKLLELVNDEAARQAAQRAEWDAESAQNRAARAAHVEELKAEAIALLGEMAAECHVEIGRDYGDSVLFHVTPDLWGGRVTFGLKKRDNEDNWRFFPDLDDDTYYRVEAAGDWTGKHIIRKQLARLHEAFIEWRDRMIEMHLAALGRGESSPEMAAAAYRELSVLAPERVAEWDAALGAWRELRAARDTAASERAEAFATYVASLAAWRENYEATLRRNRQAVKGIQKTYDAPFTRYEVRLHVAVRDEDGEALDVRETVWALAAAPDEDGYWPVFDGGRVTRRRLIAALWVGEAVTESLLDAGEGPWRVGIYADEAGQTVYALPWDAADARRAVRVGMRALPAEPERFRDGLTAVEYARLAEARHGMERVEIPF